MQISQEILQYIADHRQEALDLLIELAQIPAPSHNEKLRAEYCLQWLKRQSAVNAYIDEAMNVIWPVGCTDTNPLMVFAAHSDVVFPDTTPLPLSVSDGKIYCPGVGDDTANVVALLMAAKYIAETGLKPNGCGVLLVVNSCEEGLGNLKGSRKLMEDYGDRIREFVSFDADVYTVVNAAVGSRRYRVEIDTEGGHSYGCFGNQNAIACLAAVIQDLYTVQVPSIGKTTYNVGTVSGGTSVNTIAQHAEMLYEFRSDKREALEIMETTFREILSRHQKKGLDISVTMVGDRPCSGDVDKSAEEELSRRAALAVLHNFGREVRYGAGSTDCNIPLSLGIPAVCVGCADGSGAHTREEFVYIGSLEPGIGLAFELVLYHF